MPMKLLRWLACVELPIEIEDQDEITMCRVLRDAHLIEAVLPPLLYGDRCTRYAGTAIVRRITDLGRAASRGRVTGHSKPVVAVPDAHLAAAAGSQNTGLEIL